MENCLSFPQKIKFNIKRFFVQTFRRRTGKEYSEFLTRGIREDGNRFNRQYPWVYVRLFAVTFVLFAVYLLILRFAENELFTPTAMLLASLVFNLPFFVLLYELYPKNDLGFMPLLGALLIGGALANVLTQILYSLFPSGEGWISALLTGFFEELPKAFALIAAIVICKAKNPFVGFLFGAAVGCGFSIVEDLGYIFVYSSELPATNISTTVQLFIMRGFSSFCTHTVWSGAIGWAYCYFKRHLANLCFYAVLLFNVALHVFWDLPLDGFAYVADIAACSVLAAAEGILIVSKSRAKLLEDVRDGEQKECYFVADERSLDKSDPLTYVHRGSLSLAVGAFLMAVVAVIYCSVPFRESVYMQAFGDSQSFVEYVQEGLELPVLENRPYDADLGNYSEERVDGELVSVVQKVNYGGYDFYYTYNCNPFGGQYYLTDNIAVELTRGGLTYTVMREKLFNAGELYASFFRVKNDVTGFYFTEKGDVVAVVYDASFKRDLSQPQYTALFYTFAAIGGCSVTAFVIFNIKARRVKKYADK